MWSLCVLGIDMNSIASEPHRATTPKFPRYIADFKSFIVVEWWAESLLSLLCQSHPCLWWCGTNSIPLELDPGLELDPSLHLFAPELVRCRYKTREDTVCADLIWLHTAKFRASLTGRAGIA